MKFGLLALVILGMAGCGPSKDDVETLQESVEKLERGTATLESRVSDLETQMEDAERKRKSDARDHPNY